MGVTNIYYNGLQLTNVLTKMFDQEVVYDPSGTDAMYHKYRIRVLAYLHIQAGSNTGSVIAGASPGHKYRIASLVRSSLLSPRGLFRMTIGAGGGVPHVLLAVDPDQDVNNGPKPKGLRIVQVVSNTLLRIEWEVEICIADCGTLLKGSGVLSNRWSLTDDYDENWYSTRRIQGSLRVARIEDNPQSLRALVMPPLQRGFKVESMHFNTSTDGLTLEYTIAHKQVYTAPPFPSTTFTCTHSESTGDGFNVFGGIQIALHGPPGIDKKLLFQLAAQIMQVKLVLERNADQYVLLEQASLIDHVHSGSIELHARIRRAGRSLGDLSFTRVFGPALGETLEEAGLENYSNHEARTPKAADLSPIATLFISRLHDPCEDFAPQYQPEVEGEEYEPELTGEPPVIESTEGAVSPSEELPWEDEHYGNPYIAYDIDSRYDIDEMNVACPKARPSDDDGDDISVFSLGRPVPLRVIKLRAERVGDWPKIPIPEDYDDPVGRAKLLRCSVNPMEPRLGPDTTSVIYSMEATLEYALPKKPSLNDMLAGSAPHISPSVSFSKKLSDSMTSAAIAQSA